MDCLYELETESIYIIREVVAEFKNVAMLYSIGKDSAVLLHLAQKAFYPASLPFKLVHVDTTWKFKEMIKFRDKIAKAWIRANSIYKSKNKRIKFISIYPWLFNAY